MEYDQNKRVPRSQQEDLARSTQIPPSPIKGIRERVVEFDLRPSSEVQLDRDSVVGCLLGTAGGDSVALPLEGLSPDRASKLFSGPLRHRLLPGSGMVSDDTEHAALLVLSLLKGGDNLKVFRSELGRQIRNWVVCLPAGIGLSTLKAGVKLGLGFSPEKSGIMSAGNGPCMRRSIARGTLWK